MFPFLIIISFQVCLSDFIYFSYVTCDDVIFIWICIFYHSIFISLNFYMLWPRFVCSHEIYILCRAIYVYYRIMLYFCVNDYIGSHFRTLEKSSCVVLIAEFFHLLCSFIRLCYLLISYAVFILLLICDVLSDIFYRLLRLLLYVDHVSDDLARFVCLWAEFGSFLNFICKLLYFTI